MTRKYGPRLTRSNSTLRIQIQTMYTDTAFNSIKVVMTTLYQSFVETAMRMSRHVTELQVTKGICQPMVIGRSPPNRQLCLSGRSIPCMNRSCATA